MVLAPLMGPILGLSFGTVIKDKMLIKKAAKSEIFGFLISVLCGIIIGVLYYLLNMFYSLYYEPNIFPFPNVASEEILSRGLVTIVDILLALVIGVATGFSLTGGKFYTSLVGLAVGASLMPPIVNIGVALVLGLFNVSLGSLSIALVNISCINITALIVFKIKKIRKPSKIWIRWWRQPKLPEEELEEESPEGEE
ncbi:MAG: DUF389 domain-containing protein [Candidatus Lokiarchaeota archaeon]|nr:DUF389 domain-containing protein [Candidatus Lokiarchaeota archaeon]